MGLAAGTKLGPYEIVDLIGAGGMGEVYRARDTRLGRDVAIKLLPPSFATDADRLRRFEQEGRTIAALNHPNLLAIHDIGTHAGSPYLVSELLEGETLRARLSAQRLSTRRAIEYALQITQGLAAAHEKGIVHRDLKPENIFITREGRAKILDFGLAKLTPMGAAAAVVDGRTVSGASPTTPGMVMGTAGYMSPEQVKALPTDHRSDIFSFGAILYEMVSGQRAFKRDSSVETMTAILKEDPPEITGTQLGVSPGLDRIMRRCLEKEPEHRFQSASDLAFALEALSGATTTSAALAAAKGRRPLSLPWTWAALALIIIVLAIAGAYYAGSQRSPVVPTYQQLTFRRGTVSQARFAPDGHTIAYSADFDNEGMKVFLTRDDSLESRDAGLPRDTTLLQISANGTMAVLLRTHVVFAWSHSGTLAKVSLAGGAPREVLEDVEDADISADGENFAVVVHGNNEERLEYPIGKVLFRTPGYISAPRIGPNGTVAFLEHPTFGDNRGFVAIVDANGKSRRLTPEYASMEGLAWSPDYSELWHAGTLVGEGMSVFAVTLRGKLRRVLTTPQDLRVQDLSHDGRLLVTHHTIRFDGFSVFARDPKPHRFSWFSNESLQVYSDDGQWAAIDEFGQGSGSDYTIYWRRVDASAPAVRLGEGVPFAISPDDKWVVATRFSDPHAVSLLPTGAGEPKRYDLGALSDLHDAYFGTMSHLWFSAADASGAQHDYLLDLNSGKIVPAGTDPRLLGVREDAGQLLLLDGVKLLLYDTRAHSSRVVISLPAAERALRWSADGKTFFSFDPNLGGSIKIYATDIATGRHTLWKEIMPQELTAERGRIVTISADASAYTYTQSRDLSEAYLVTGVK